MKKISLFILLGAFSCGIYSCKKDTAGHETFFTQNIDSVNVLTLFIDDKYVGPVPYSPDILGDCKEGNNLSLNVHLKNGKHYLLLKDESDKGLSDSYLTLRCNKTKISSAKLGGGSSFKKNEDCVIGFFFEGNAE